jgi:RNA polymerase sigma factor (sigma-70 family)
MADEAGNALHPVQGAVEATLIENRRDFMRFLVRRTGDTDTAEDILQQFYLRAVGKGDALRKSESVVAWLYQLLRTTLVDHFRRETSRRRREADYAQMEILSAEGHDAELEGVICACFETLLPTLKAEYADILQRVDLRGATPGEVARDLGLAPNNVRVRLHRARQAMKHSLLLSCRACAEHSCLDCHCGRPGLAPVQIT